MPEMMPEPTDEAWELNVMLYYAAGWEGAPTDIDRMFWEAGFKQGAAAANLLATAHKPTVSEEDHG